MTMMSAPSASAMVTTTTTKTNAPPLKAVTSSQCSSGAADDASSAPSASTKADSALLELRSLALAASSSSSSATADARSVDAVLERFTSLVRRPSQETEGERERKGQKLKTRCLIQLDPDLANLSLRNFKNKNISGRPLPGGPAPPRPAPALDHRHVPGSSALPSGESRKHSPDGLPRPTPLVGRLRPRKKSSPPVLSRRGRGL